MIQSTVATIVKRVFAKCIQNYKTVLNRIGVKQGPQIRNTHAGTSDQLLSNHKFKYENSRP